MSASQQVLAELEQLGRRPDRLIDLEPAIRATLQGAARDRALALKRCNFIAAEGWRRCQVAAALLLQGVEDAAQ